MLFSSTYTFAWDLVIALLLGMSFGVCLVAAIHLRRRKGVLTWTGIAMTGLLPALVFATVPYGSFVEPQFITVTTERIALPIKQPLKIVVLSDLHVGPYKDAAYIQRVVDRVNELVPDVVLLAGDYLLGDTADETVANDLAPLQSLHAAFGTFAVLGNHDHGLYRTLLGLNRPPDDPGEAVAGILTGAGITVLQNESAVIDFGTNRLAIAGIEDRWFPTSDVSKAMEGIPAGTPIVLLAHNPDVILDERSSSASLIIAGHTDGGQIRLP
ncbi:MAG TPA: metallophosphoesterase, partial [Candidatus Peribacteria bacterium]|nr:metallophosphoesterase [Candidatus Peribacteria bacterium]